MSMSGVNALRLARRPGPGTQLSFTTSYRHKSQFNHRSLSSPYHMATTQSEEPVRERDSLHMQAWQCAGYDGVEGLSLATVRIPPVLRPNDILVKVHAASVNPIDASLISGYGSQVLNMLRLAGQLEQGIADPNFIEFPITGGRDFTGEVVSVGHCASGVKVGQHVMGVVSPQRQGSHAEYVVTPASNVCLVPKGVTNEEAASVPYVGLTGWNAVVISGMMRPNEALGKRVLVLGAAGGVGSFLCQLLSAWGAQVTGVCSGDAENLVAGLGAEPLDYCDPGTKQMLIRDGGYDLVVNCSGSDDLEYLGALKSWMWASYVTLSPPLLTNIDNSGIVGGLIKSVRDVVLGNARSVSQGRLYKWAFFMPNPCALKHITDHMAKHRIRGVVGQIFPFSEAPEAYSHVIAGHARGKTIITMQ